MNGDEKTFLKEIVTRYIHSVECKKTDAVSVLEKKKVWVTITQKLNSIGKHSNRTAEQLRKCWENMKSRRKKELANQKVNRMATGGGPYTPPVDAENAIVDDVLNLVDIEIEDSIDSDTITIMSVSKDNPQERGSYKPPTDDEDAVVDDIFSSVDIELKDSVDSDTITMAGVPESKAHPDVSVAAEEESICMPLNACYEAKVESAEEPVVMHKNVNVTGHPTDSGEVNGNSDANLEVSNNVSPSVNSNAIGINRETNCELRRSTSNKVKFRLQFLIKKRVQQTLELASVGNLITNIELAYTKRR
ncbi:hypothetical protein RN001_012530 [Aquatica leii]|uniref:Regulatory protein zeste n=1 Tax=Aquatica leii TaxID=1421715 RepID=A0AAN7QF15_9COLE|nr:hypothetical protein RN001_012530 [Aquatica leii]